jgi:hypothetical protein
MDREGGGGSFQPDQFVLGLYMHACVKPKSGHYNYSNKLEAYALYGVTNLANEQRQLTTYSLLMMG